MNIKEWLQELESDRSLSIEQFYAKVKGAISVLRERLELADADGVDLSDIEEDEG